MEKSDQSCWKWISALTFITSHHIYLLRLIFKSYNIFIHKYDLKKGLSINEKKKQLQQLHSKTYQTPQSFQKRSIHHKTGEWRLEFPKREGVSKLCSESRASPWRCSDGDGNEEEDLTTPQLGKEGCLQMHGISD